MAKDTEFGSGFNHQISDITKLVAEHKPISKKKIEKEIKNQDSPELPIPDYTAVKLGHWVNGRTHFEMKAIAYAKRTDLQTIINEALKEFTQKHSDHIEDWKREYNEHERLKAERQKQMQLSKPPKKPKLTTK